MMKWIWMKFCMLVAEAYNQRWMAIYAEYGLCPQMLRAMEKHHEWTGRAFYFTKNEGEEDE